MSSLTNIQIKLDGIGHILTDKKLSVPTYQRSYAWEEKNIRDLFIDINEAQKNKEKEYFLGSIVVATNGSNPVVVDGQQRLATITILLSSIRDYFYEKGDKERANDLESNYLFSRSLRTKESSPKLNLNEGDNDYFYKNVVLFQKNKQSSEKDSHRKIKRAYEIAKDHIDSLMKINKKPDDVLIDLVEYITDSVRVILVEVPDYANAFTIFETLNDRGLDLAITDLLKNYLYNLSDNRIEETKTRWVSMIGTFETLGDEDEITSYIKSLWSTYYGVVREKDLYQEIKKRITTKQDSIDFAIKLASNAKVYTAILNPNHEFWNDFPSETKDYISTLKLLGLIAIRPLLMSILDSFSHQDINSSLKLLVSTVVRYMVCGTLSTGVFEKQFSDLAIKVRTKKIKSSKELFIEMKKQVPNDTLFLERFADASVFKSSLARYYLQVLEKQLKGERDPELIPNPNEQQVNLEHVLPISPSTKWNHIASEDAKGYCRRIGNLTLMKSKINAMKGNDSFTSKVKEFKNSEFMITNSIASYNTWNIENIKERQLFLANYAVKAWPLKTP